MQVKHGGAAWRTVVFAVVFVMVVFGYFTQPRTLVREFVAQHVLAQLHEQAVAAADNDKFSEAQQLFETGTRLCSRELNSPSALAEKFRENYALTLVRWADVLLRNEQTTEATAALERAIAIDPELSLAYVKLADFANESNQLTTAVALYDKAYDERGAQVVKDYALNRKLQLEDEIAAITQHTYQSYTDHGGLFVLDVPQYDGAVAPEKIVNWLCDARKSLATQYDLTSSRPLHIRVFHTEDFARLSDAPSWAVAAYDLRLRVNLASLEASDPKVEDTVWHEYAHALIERTLPRAVPVWFQEGFAQVIEPNAAFDPRETELALAVSTTDSLQHLSENSFADLQNPDEAERAYLISKAFVQHLADYKEDRRALRQLFAYMRDGEDFDTAFRLSMDACIKAVYDKWRNQNPL